MQRSGTLLAIHKVFSSMLAFSSEGPSEKAHSRDRHTSVWNSCSLADTVIAAEALGRDGTEEAKEEFCEKLSTSESNGCSSSDIIEPESNSTRSVKSSPSKIAPYYRLWRSSEHRVDANIPNCVSRQLLKLSSLLLYPSLPSFCATALQGHTKVSDSGPRFCKMACWSTIRAGFAQCPKQEQ